MKAGPCFQLYKLNETKGEWDMQEKELRRWHKKVGITLAFLLVMQGATGLIFTFKKAFEVPPVSSQNLGDHRVEDEHHNDAEHSRVDPGHDRGYREENHGHDHGEGAVALFAAIHHGGGIAGFVYRLITGLGILWMAGTGSLIYFRTKARQGNT
jgi:uncharacterized iron-regulated membrane protein